MAVKRVLLSWSSGKDSAWALHVLRQQPGIEVVALFTTFNGVFDRVAMHAVRRTLVRQQAFAAGLSLWEVDLPWPCTNQQYEALLTHTWARAASEGVHAVAFGDLFLADVRAYRERQLDGTGLEPLFPLWGMPTPALAQTMIDANVRARLTCIDPNQLPPLLAGADFDRQLLDCLPSDADPCGEKGEFHTFVYAAPVFSNPIPVTIGETIMRDGFLFTDALPQPGLISESPHPPDPVPRSGSASGEPRP